MKKRILLKKLGMPLCLVCMAAVILLFTGGLNSSLALESNLYQGQAAKYVFFFIGDGMGIPQRMAAEKFRNVKLTVDTFPAQGITTTHAADRFITGSAASATALAAAQKTNIGMIGMAPDQRHVKSISEIAKEKGKKVGVISSVSIDHATPAAFYAHVKSRNMYYDIDIALADSGFDFFGGGGIKDPENKRENATVFKGNALEYIKSKGYKLVNSKTEFMNLDASDGKVFAWNAWLQDSGALPYAMDTRQEDISLVEFTSKAIEMLDNPKGFFLMVEGGKIDWACHANDATASILDTLAFDEAVDEAVAFAKKHPKETLIVVTGDHECGGLTLGFAGTVYESYYDILKTQNVSFQKFSGELLGAYKEGCTGNCKFDDVKSMITQHFGLKFEGDPKADQLVLEEYQIDMLEDAYLRSMVGDKVKSEDPSTSLLYGSYEPLTIAITHVLNNKAGLGWTSYSHTGVPVSTSAMGVGAEIFNGYYDNTDVGKKIMSVMGVPAKIHYASHQEMPKLASYE